VTDRLPIRPTALGTRLGACGGTNLPTVSIAKAHLDDLVRRGSAAPLRTRKGNS
jgi:hypothetical protein